MKLKKHKNNKPINYAFYGIAFLYLCLLSTLSIFITPLLWQTKIFFLLYSFGQAFLEISILLLIGTWIKRRLPGWIYKVFIGVCFLIFLGHFVDFTLIRLLDASMSYMFKLFFGEGLLHFFNALIALNLNQSMLILGALLFLFIPIVGILLYEGTRFLIRKKTWNYSKSSLSKGLFSILLVLLALDFAASPIIGASVYAQYKKMLPWGRFFFPPQHETLLLNGKIKPERKEEFSQEMLKTKHFSIDKKPNIFLFVIETLRKDHITSEIAPNLWAFQKEFLSFPISLANANGTHTSWFSIFHADFPYYWQKVKNSWNKGSIPLQALKNMGYKIRTYSSADLSYFQMDETLFGKNLGLLDEYRDFGKEWNTKAALRDQKTLKSLEEDLKEKSMKDGNVFIIFLDATHSEYSWPDDFPAKFTPFVENIDYLGLASTKKDLQFVKNRYKNAIHYIDHLFGSFQDILKKEQLFDEAVIAITGDHGEEFFEEGALFHGTHMNEFQTSVPILYKFGKSSPAPKGTMTSHMDIFPSIIHYLTGEENFSDLFDGESIFSMKKRPYILSAQQNGAGTPTDFFLHNGQYKMTLRTKDLKNDIQEVEILNIEDSQGNSINSGEREKILHTNFKEILETLTELK